MRSVHLVVAVTVALLSFSSFAHAAGPDSAGETSDSPVVKSSDSEDASEEIPTLESADVVFSGEPEYGGYLSLTSQVGKVTDQAGVFLGARIGVIISHTLTIGGGLNWLIEGPTAETDGDPAIQSVYGGGLIGLTLASDSVVHPTIEVLVGGGEVRNKYRGVRFANDKTNIFVVDASAGLDINLATGVRLHLGGGYRYVSDVALSGVTAADLDGGFGVAQLKFGVF